MNTPAADIYFRLVAIADNCIHESCSSLNALGQLLALPALCYTDSICYADHPSQLDLRRPAAHQFRLKG